MNQATLGGVINWSAVGVAQFAPIYGMPIVWTICAMFLVGAALMVSATIKESKRQRK